MDLNDVAVQLTLMEGKKEPISNAQVKEVLGCLGRYARSLPEQERLELFAAIEARAGMES